MNSEAADRLHEYGRAKQAGRLGWTMAQTLAVDPEVAFLCERLGWRGDAGFTRMQSSPAQMIRDFIDIAQMEAERERRKRGNTN